MIEKTKIDMNLTRRGRVPSSKWSAAFQIIAPAVRHLRLFSLVLVLFNVPSLFAVSQCTAMSSEECNRLVGSASDEMFKLSNLINQLRDSVSSLSDDFKDLKDKWDVFSGEWTYWEYQIGSKTDWEFDMNNTFFSSFESLAWDLMEILKRMGVANFENPYTSQSIMASQFASEATEVCWELLEKMQSKLTELINPVFGPFYDVDDKMTSVTNQVKNNKFDVYGALNYLAQVNCDACTECESGGTNGTCSAGCPCKETIEELISVATEQLEKLNVLVPLVEELKTKLDNIKDSVDEFKTVFENFARENLEALSVISNSAYRIDVYVNDDLKKAMSSLSNNVELLKKDLSLIVPFYPSFSNDLKQVNAHLSNADYLFVSFSNTQSSAEFDGSLLTKMDEVFNSSDNGFYESAYSDLSWWSRVELLLAKIAGVGQTNGLNQVNVNAVSNSVSALGSLDTSSLSSSFDTVGESVVSVVSSFKGLFSSPSLPEDGLTFLPVEIFQNVGNSSEGGSSVWESFGSINLKIPDEVIEPCRVVTSTIWTGSFLVSLYLLFVNYWGVASSYIVTFFKYLISILS